MKKSEKRKFKKMIKKMIKKKGGLELLTPPKQKKGRF